MNKQVLRILEMKCMKREGLLILYTLIFKRPSIKYHIGNY